MVHDVACRLAPSCLPIFSSDGLALYFYSLTAHFGQWSQTLDQRRRHWAVEPRLLYAQIVKHFRRRRLAVVEHRVPLGTPDAFRLALRALGLSGRIQTAFIERLNLTMRRSIASLARRSWSSAHSLAELTFQFDWPATCGSGWWRAYYHFARPHASLRLPLAHQVPTPTRPRYRGRTPAQAAGLTGHRWTVLELLACPAPPLAAAG